VLLGRHINLPDSPVEKKIARDVGVIPIEPPHGHDLANGLVQLASTPIFLDLLATGTLRLLLFLAGPQRVGLVQREFAVRLRFRAAGFVRLTGRPGLVLASFLLGLALRQPQRAQLVL